MEENTVPTAPASDTMEMKLNEHDRQNILTAAKWAKFLAILGFIVLAIAAVITLFALLGIGIGGAMFPGMEAAGVRIPMMVTMTVTILISILILLIVEFYPLFFMYRFAERAIKAIESHNSELMSESFLNLRRYYKFVGILTVIVLCFYLLAFIISMAAGLGAGFCPMRHI